MIITRLKGGMGNQMFQYAMALSVAHKLDVELKIDLCSLLDRSKGDFVYRNYDLSIFAVPPNFVHSESLLQHLSKLKSSSVTKFFRNRVNRGRKHIKETAFQYDQKYQKEAVDKTIFEGWFQSHRYFSEITPLIKQRFTFKNSILPESQELLQKIQNTKAVCLNVRRTDFLKVDTLNTTNLDYFIKAAKLIAERTENPEFFIFSDDIEWCRENIRLDHPLTVVSHEHKGEKFGNYMQLMIACRHFIIPNSSFAWWAVWLNDHTEKIVVAPKNWFTDPAIDTSDLVMDSWLRI